MRSDFSLQTNCPYCCMVLVAVVVVVIVVVVVVVVFTLKTVLTSIQYLLFLTLQGKETNFQKEKEKEKESGHKLTQNKVQKNKIK